MSPRPPNDDITAFYLMHNEKAASLNFVSGGDNILFYLL